MSEDDTRAQRRIQELLEERATLREQVTTLKRQVDERPEAKTLQTLEAQVATLTHKRDTVRTELATREAGWSTERVLLSAGVKGETEAKALQALHGIYGGDKPLAEWLKAPDKLPAAARALLPSTDGAAGGAAGDAAGAAAGGAAGQGAGQAGGAAGADAAGGGGLPRDPGGRAAGAPKPRSVDDLAKLPPAEFQKLAKEAGGVPQLMRLVASSTAA